MDASSTTSYRPATSLRFALRAAAALPIDDSFVAECAREDHVFRRTWRDGIATVPAPERRGRLCVELGVVAESVATLLLEASGLDVFAQLTGVGAHGVDLLALTPAGQVLAVEVKGTLRRGALPRLGRGQRRQMSLEWLSSPDNPGMLEWDLAGEDIYGCVALLDFAAMAWRAAVTGDYAHYAAVTDVAELHDLAHLEVPASP